MRMIRRGMLLLLVLLSYPVFYLTVHEVPNLNDGAGILRFLFALVFFLVALFFSSLYWRKKADSSRKYIGMDDPSYTPSSTALFRVDLALKTLGLLLPARIMKEDAGDAREVIEKLYGEGAPPWMIYTKLASSIFWILLAAIREVLTVTKRKPN